MRTPEGVRTRAGRSLDRLVNFTDAIVAVAITVLILPIVDLRPTPGEDTVWAVMSDNAGQIVTFAFTFVVVAYMWRVHTRIFGRLAGFDDTVFWLNLLWLMLIVFLPWSSSMYGSGMDAFAGAAGGSGWFAGGEGLGGAGLLYWVNLGAISIVGGLVGTHARRHPNLIDDQEPRSSKDSSLVRNRGLVFGGYMIVIGVLTVVVPVVAIWLPLGFFVLGFLLRRQEV